MLLYFTFTVTLGSSLNKALLSLPLYIGNPGLKSQISWSAKSRISAAQTVTSLELLSGAFALHSSACVVVSQLHKRGGGEGIPSALTDGQLCLLSISSSRIVLYPRYLKLLQCMLLVLVILSQQRTWIPYQLPPPQLANPRNIAADRDSPEELQPCVLCSWWRLVFLLLLKRHR